MKKIIAVMILAGSVLWADVTAAEKQLVQSVIPGSNIKDIDKTPIDGLYIVLLENKKFLYVHTYKNLIFFGEILTKNGQNLSRYLKDHMLKANEDRTEIIAQVAKNKENIEKMKKTALQVMYNEGNENFAIYTFTDPDCPYCQEVEEFYTQSNADVRYVFTPLKRLHPRSENKTKQILSNQDKIKKILTEIRNEKDIKYPIKKESDLDLLTMEKITKDFDLNGTPTMIIYDKKTNKIIDLINGADIDKLGKYVGEKR